jgi:hypothetical protein
MLSGRTNYEKGMRKRETAKKKEERSREREIKRLKYMQKR